MFTEDSFPWWRRVVPGIVLIGLGLGLIVHRTAPGTATIPMTLFTALGCLALIIGGAIMIAKPLAILLAEPIVQLLWPEDHSYIPPPLYALPRHYWKEGRLEEACREYKKITTHHPQELVAYIEWITLLLLINQPEQAQTVFKRATLKLKDPSARQSLQETYQRLLTGDSPSNETAASGERPHE